MFTTTSVPVNSFSFNPGPTYTVKDHFLMVEAGLDENGRYYKITNPSDMKPSWLAGKKATFYIAPIFFGQEVDPIQGVFDADGYFRV